jgi:hypothetical protein
MLSVYAVDRGIRGWNTGNSLSLRWKAFRQNLMKSLAEMRLKGLHAQRLKK